MQLSLSVNINDLLHTDKTNLFERWAARPRVFSSGSMQDTFTQLKQAGIQGMELVVVERTTDADIAAVLAIVEQYKMPVLSIHMPLVKTFSLGLKDIAVLVRFAQRLSAKLLILHCPAIFKKTNDKDFIGSIKQYEDIYKVKVVIENMEKSVVTFYEKNYWKEPYFSGMCKQMGFAINLDVCHLVQSGGNEETFLKDNIQYIAGIHLSDSGVGFWAKQHLALGDGEIPMISFLQDVRNRNYKGVITLEIRGDVESILSSARMVQNIFV